MCATAGGVAGALILFIINNVTARQELRRKHAEAGRSLITEMCDDIEAQNAFAIIDMEDGAEVTLKDKDHSADGAGESNDVKVTWEQALAALSDDKTVDAYARELMRAAFDGLFEVRAQEPMLSEYASTPDPTQRPRGRARGRSKNRNDSRVLAVTPRTQEGRSALRSPEACSQA
jgi:hypothetical protein